MAKFFNQRRPKNAPVRFKNIETPSQNVVIFGKQEGPFNFILKDKLALGFALGWLIPLIFISLYSFLNIGNLSSQIPLYYSRIWGEAQLASKNMIYLPIAGILVIGICNFLISLYLGKKDKLFTYLLFGTAAIVSVLATITVFNIINLIT